MPTQSTTYNSRVTDEKLEKRFRDTFRSQGGAELVDDLYAQGVIVPVVDFTAAATGTTLAQNLQTAWDFSTGSAVISDPTPTTIISNAGFWLVDLIYNGFSSINTANRYEATVDIYDGSNYKAVWAFSNRINGTNVNEITQENRFVVFLRSGDSLTAQVQLNTNYTMTIWYRQIATVNGDLVNPTGFTSS